MNISLTHLRRILAYLCVGFFALAGMLHAEEPLPIAQTVVVSGENRSTGAVVRYSETTNTYAVATSTADTATYGVIAERPAIVFVTATSTIPVVASGVASVQTSEQNGPISRGTVLMSSTIPGVAVRASTTDRGVFAVALGAPDPFTGLVTADVSVTRAVAYQAAKREQQQLASTAAEASEPPLVRLVIATMLVVIAVAFLLFSYRTILNSGVVSIGRNPRARQSVMYVTIGSTAFAIVIAIIIVLVALGVVVVPL